MKKIKLVIAYDGTDFSGFQSQPGQRTIQGTLEEALRKITGEAVSVHGSGRTDAGVHALHQVCHFTTSSPIPVEKYPYILRRTLPRDVLALSAEEAPMDFHAQKSAKWKTYRYRLDLRPIPDLFERRFRTHVPVSLDVEKMREAAGYLVGTHDFTSFCSAKTEIQDKVRTIYQCRLEQEPGGLVIEVTGNGFLYNMVRIIAGTLVEVGKGRIRPEAIPGIILAKDRQKAGPTFPPEGLVLVKVGYTPWKNSGFTASFS
ncbi:tRNA pseudouridine(38-40) synthase TruA [Thermoactinomyces intermedius]|uniref:tRNA pseudouridine synthase A n=1 Tax=Thermoactinomyces intermedius TaxID=2024 RepID=A0A8I1DF76_THEIN|nr:MULTISPECIES: tRNA pseudouridine(38-40) synthase TruA [Thermoactinomyces]MBA4549411.1 tRNA pseudouridine(38-40) synthase TruA [Thermoactinomyces intermedius]MBA4837334.1 tRNA pseudouridine(38-40) synthase TruA [Thermoactinomyces intermedius]MBH8595692.1 tRNA pseudouridine(38-40) synthase TruA [Thermoactinomyces intermedius]MBH8600717.1 tRNA pseudouridine(38-40) synthase TruA [Thermoactinomyces sp. CICC 23799]